MTPIYSCEIKTSNQTFVEHKKLLENHLWYIYLLININPIQESNILFTLPN